MKITIDKNELYKEPEVVIKCRAISHEVQEIISVISVIGKNLAGEIDGETFFIPLAEILYFESVEGCIFFYTDKTVYKSQSRLYNLEEGLRDTYFVRVSKTAIVNLKKLKSIKREKNSRLLGTLANGEKIMISRGYVAEIRKKLGV
ncbi:MAG: LytTR family transcriptional regulator DNA-binding domain-containing protein [Clostridia bacterium]|nr:LytTR family transcriptional regulator DNA-binding domain-containing protein [Clostridia bacterium]